MADTSLRIGGGKWAVKEDSLLGYNVIQNKYVPIEMDTVRATTATRVNENGLIEQVPYNLASYSEDFDNAYWTVSNATITSNSIVAPNGTTTADTISGTTIGAEPRARQTTAQIGSSVYSLSCYAKKGTVDWVILRNIAVNLGGGSRTWFNLNTGVVGTTNSGISATIESVGNGWYRCTIYGTTDASPTNLIDIAPAPADNDFTTNASGENVYIWGAQLNIGATAKPYFPTTDRLNVPRIDYSGGTASLLVEPQRTNLITYPISFGNSYWTKSGAMIGGNPASAGAEIVEQPLALTTAGWNVQSGGVIDDDNTFHTVGGVGGVRDIIGLVVGKMYKVEIAGTVTGNFDIQISSGGTTQNTGISASTGAFDYTGVNAKYFTVNSGLTNLYFYLRLLNNGDAMDITTLSVKEITQGYSAPSVDFPTSAFKLVENSATSTHFLKRQGFTVSANKYSYSVFAKKGGRNKIRLFLSNYFVSGTNAIFDLENGTVVTDAEATATITLMADGFYKCTITSVSNAIAGSNAFCEIFLANDSDSITYTGDGTSGVYIYGAQLEAGSYPTSLTFTSSSTEGSTVTRNADVISKTGISSLIGQTEGTVFLQFDNRLLASYSNEYTFQILGSGGHQLWMRKESGSPYFTARLIVSSSTIWTFTGIPVPNGNTKIAISYKTGDSAIYLNGTQFGSTNTAAFSGNSFTDFYFNLQGTANPELILNQAILFKTRLSNDELATLTTI